MLGCVRLEASERLRQLAFGSDAPASPRLVPGDSDVDESLEEVALVRGRGAPGVLELLVRGEVLPRADQLHTSSIRGLELLRLPPGRRTCAAGWRGRTRSGRCARRIASRATDTSARSLRANPRRAVPRDGDSALG